MDRKNLYRKLSPGMLSPHICIYKRYSVVEMKSRFGIEWFESLRKGRSGMICTISNWNFCKHIFIKKKRIRYFIYSHLDCSTYFMAMYQEGHVNILAISDLTRFSRYKTLIDSVIPTEIMTRGRAL